MVLKAGLAAGLAWAVASAVTNVPDPLLAPLTAIVTVQVSVRASVRVAIQRSIAVVLGVFLALLISDVVQLNGFTVGVLVALSLGVAELLLRLPGPAATQVPISILVVLTAVAADPEQSGWRRAFDTLLGAAVGMAVSLALPVSRRRDARQALARLGETLASVLEQMGTGIQQPWTPEQSEEWRKRARTIRDRLVRRVADAVGNGREAARWNRRDRKHIVELGRYEDAMPRLEKTAIGVVAAARGLDEAARRAGEQHGAMPEMGALLRALGEAIRVVVLNLLGAEPDEDVARTLDDVRARRMECAPDVFRRARIALDHETFDAAEANSEWLTYAALLVQVDRIVTDISAPLPS